MPPYRPLLIAHRGDSADHPENTHAAFSAAVAAGVDGIELDVRLTADDEVVVCHDGTLARFGGSLMPLSRIPWERLRDADVGGWFGKDFRGEHPPSLGDVLDRYARGTDLLIELKPPRSAAGAKRLCQRVVAEVAERRLHRQVMILCFDAALLRQVRRLDDGLRVVLNTSTRPRALERIAREVDAIDIDRRRLTPEFARRCHDAGLKLFTWTCNNAKHLDHALACGVDGVLSDRAPWLVDQAARRLPPAVR
ncbi:MAG: hypothetical protein H0W72_03520 [Planctomycetes bacterium]|nr:hypothetical protein [Planctomycetota bacterium]